MRKLLTDLDIFWLFGYRCVWQGPNCTHRASELNHIIPRSRDKTRIDDPRNKVPMCRACHEEYHRGGVTPDKVELLTQKRITVLTLMHKAEYV